MIAYLIKSILCSALFLLVYLLWIEKEPMHVFKRWYLLIAIPAAFLIPLVPLPGIQPVQVEIGYTELWMAPSQAAPAETTTASGSASSPLPAFTILYTVVALVLSVRFVINLLRLTRMAHAGTGFRNNGVRIVIVRGNGTSYTFLNTIFMNEADYADDQSENRILMHEMAHVKQRHSIDILFIEAVRILWWFNPVFILYKRAIQLNHEFLADNAVVTHCSDISSYQHLLLDRISAAGSVSLSSRFNYSFTKKRLVMMTRTSSFTAKLLKKLSVLPVASAAILVFAARESDAQNPVQRKQGETLKETSKVFAGNDTTAPRLHPFITKTPFTIQGVSEERMNTYRNIERKYLSDIIADKKHGWPAFTKADRDTLETIFKQMSRSQQASVHVIFYPPVKPFDKEPPSNEQLVKWKNAPSQYGVWVNDKRVDNASLANYQPSDFSHYFASRLSPNAVNYGKHYVQIDLMTNAYYTVYRANALAKKEFNFALQHMRDPI